MSRLLLGQVKHSLLGQGSLSQDQALVAAATFASAAPLSKKDVLAEVRAKAPPAFVDEHMADVKAWNLQSAAKHLSMQRLVDL